MLTYKPEEVGRPSRRNVAFKHYKKRSSYFLYKNSPILIHKHLFQQYFCWFIYYTYLVVVVVVFFFSCNHVYALVLESFFVFRLNHSYTLFSGSNLSVLMNLQIRNYNRQTMNYINCKKWQSSKILIEDLIWYIGTDRRQGNSYWRRRLNNHIFMNISSMLY